MNSNDLAPLRTTRVGVAIDQDCFFCKVMRFSEVGEEAESWDSEEEYDDEVEVLYDWSYEDLLALDDDVVTVAHC